MNCCFYSEKVESGRDEEYRCSRQQETGLKVRRRRHKTKWIKEETIPHN
jgi:hypothetical protein